MYELVITQWAKEVDELVIVFGCLGHEFTFVFGVCFHTRFIYCTSKVVLKKRLKSDFSKMFL